MKPIKLILFLLLLNSSKTYSCSYYPTGEDIRFSLFSSNLSGQLDMEQLFYSAHFFNEYSKKTLNGPDENIEEWYVYFDEKFKRSEIDELIYQVKYDKPQNILFKNSLYIYFKENNDSETKNYILFAKKVEHILYTDYWSNIKIDMEAAKTALNIALEKSKIIQSQMLKLRYAYQAMVLSYYIGETDIGLNIYTETVAPLNDTSVITTWCLFHKANMISDKYEKFRLYAMVFEKSRSKNAYIFQRFPTDEQEVNKILDKCKNNAEKAAVYSVLAFKKPGRAMDQIKQIVELDPKSSLIDVLLIREINKIEDWFYTNRYTGYGTAILLDGREEYTGDYREGYSGIDEQNFKEDKKYLLKMYDFSNAIVNQGLIENKILWNLSLAYMGYIMNDRIKSEKHLKDAKLAKPNHLENGQIAIIELLSFMKFEENWDNAFQEKLYIQLNGLEKFERDLYNYDRFYGQIMLAISRKYLEEDNIILAGLFEGKVSGGTTELYSGWGDGSYQCFDLLNDNAKSEDMDAFFELWEKPNKTNLENFLFSDMEKWKWRFTDLYATSYLREDKLEKALEIYETIPVDVWQDTIPEYHYFYAQELDANPFETRFSRSNISDDYSISYTKPEFVREILRLKNVAETSLENRAYNYMLLGNAYYNMTAAGNSWYYTEYSLGWVGAEYGYSNYNKNFFNAERALTYYKLAESTSKSEEFAAFCYRLQYKCIALRDSEIVTTYSKQYRKKFIQKYPNHYEKLRGCDHFTYYFGTWKDA